MAPVSGTAPAIEQPGHRVSLLAWLCGDHTLASKDVFPPLCYIRQAFSAYIAEQLDSANVNTSKLLPPLPTALGKFRLIPFIVEAERFWLYFAGGKKNRWEAADFRH